LHEVGAGAFRPDTSTTESESRVRSV
jgi:hypothetical protein